MTFQEAAKQLAALGVRLLRRPAEYHLCWSGGVTPVHVTDDLDEALRIGRAMAADKPKKELPQMGPLGRRTHRGDIIRHNRKLLKRRQMKETRF